MSIDYRLHPSRIAIETHFDGILSPGISQKFKLKSFIRFDKSLQNNDSLTHQITLLPEDPQVKEDPQKRAELFLPGNISKVLNYITQTYGPDAPFTIINVDNKTEGHITILIKETNIQHISELGKYKPMEPSEEILERYSDLVKGWGIEIMKNGETGLYIFIKGNYFTIYQPTEERDKNDSVEIRIHLKLFRPELNGKLATL